MPPIIEPIGEGDNVHERRRLSGGAAIAGIVLAGGRSSRMGQDKAALVFAGVPLLTRTVGALAEVADEIVIVRAPDQRLPALPPGVQARVVADPVEGEGPLRGMATGLAAVDASVAVVVGVDMPFLRPELLRLLAETVSEQRRWVLPIAGRRPQPLCSAFARDALPVLEAHLAAGDRAPMAVGADLGYYRMPPEEWARADPHGWSFVDVDTPEDFAEAERLLREGGAPGTGEG